MKNLQGRGGIDVSAIVHGTWRPRSRRKPLLALGVLAALAGTQVGCETLNPITVGVGLASFAATGKGLADHAFGVLTQSDCNIPDGLLNAERRICEPHGSVAAQQRFKGIFASAHDNPPALRLSERPVALSPALSSLQFPEADALGSLRLSDSIVPIAVAPAEGPLAGRDQSLHTISQSL